MDRLFKKLGRFDRPELYIRAFWHVVLTHFFSSINSLFKTSPSDWH